MGGKGRGDEGDQEGGGGVRDMGAECGGGEAENGGGGWRREGMRMWETRGETGQGGKRERERKRRDSEDNWPIPPGRGKGMYWGLVGYN